MCDDDELKIGAIASATEDNGSLGFALPKSQYDPRATASASETAFETGKDYQGPTPSPSFDVEAVKLNFSQERFDQLVEQARAIRVERRQAEIAAKDARQRLDALRVMESDAMSTLREIVRSHVGYERFESDGLRL